MTGLKMVARFNMGLKQTYKTIMSVNSAVLCNNLIYFLRRIPLIKNIISETLYAAYGTKDAIKVFAVILNFFKSVFGTVIYLGIFFYVPLLSAKSNNINISDKDVLLCCLTIFFFMNYLAGGVFMHELKPNANDRTMMLLRYLKLNPKSYYISQTIVGYISKVLTMFVPMLIGAKLIGLGLVNVPILLIGMISMRIFIDGLELLPFNMWINDKTAAQVVKYMTVTILCFAGAYLQIFFTGIRRIEQIYIPYIVSPVAIPVYLLIAVIGLLLIKRFDDYTELVRREFKELETVAEIKVGANAKAMVLKEDELDMHERKSASKKSGYAYLDAMFMQRHRKLFFKRAVRFAIIAFVLPLALGIFSKLTGKNLMADLIGPIGIWIFIIYVIAFKENYTKALFNNIDKYMLCYKWYRRPGAILSSYFIRLKSSFLMNGLITLPLIFGIVIGGMLSSVRIKSILLLVVMLVILTLFYSVHYLTMYYMLQPYTDQSKIKSPIYSISNTFIYAFSLVMMQIKSVPMWLYLLICAVVLIYMLVSFSMMKRLAPKTFKRKE
ncbi:Uncharacterised protein [[Eubacterium] infirmum]|nr:Uncharacterised protein [[Eubacterium] infirmum]